MKRAINKLLPFLTYRSDQPSAAPPATSVPVMARSTTSDNANRPDDQIETLTHKGGPLPVTDHQRAHCVVLKDGRFLVHSPYLGDADLLSAVQRSAAAVRIILRPPEATDLPTIRGYYRTSTAAAPLHDRMRGRFLNLLTVGAASRVSDVQVIPEGGRAKVQFQVQGFLTAPDPANDISTSDLEALYTAVFQMAGHGAQIENKHAEQKVTITDRTVLPPDVVGARVQWVPNGHGRHMNCRLLYEKLPTKQAGLQALRLPQDIEDHLMFLLSNSQGLFTICGPTESGKSFTQTCFLLSLRERHGHSVLIISLADPPEGFYDGIVHYPLDAEEDAFGHSLIESRVLASLRVAPHFINFAEIRTPKMAEQAFVASTQGKFILATVHTYDALDTPYRYTKLGVSHSDAFRADRHAALMSQRLVPRLCPHCRVPLPEAAKHNRHYAGELSVYRAALGDLADLIFVRGSGCNHCHRPNHLYHPGLLDRTLYPELVRPDRRLFTLLREEAANGSETYDRAREYWFKDMGGMSMRLRAFDDLINGHIGVTEFTTFFGDPYSLAADISMHHGFKDRYPVRRRAA